jgi:hypothetical protein
MARGFVFQSGLSEAAIRERAENMQVAVAEIVDGKEPPDRQGQSRSHALDELTSWQVARGRNGEPALVINDVTPRAGADHLRVASTLKARLLCNLLGIFADEVDAAWKRYAEHNRTPAGGPVTTWPNR